MPQQSLILLHGALGSERQFDILKSHLDTHFDVHTLNFEGHGGIPLSGSFGIELFTQNVLDYMKSQGLESAAIFGYSMGGYVALSLAKSHPERVEKIVTLGTKFAWTPEFSALEIKKLNPDKLEEKVPKFAKHLESVHAPLDWKEVVRDTANMMVDLGENPVLDDHGYRSILTPALVCLGSLDSMSTEEESRNVAVILPNGEFKLIPDFEHPIERVDPSILAGIIVGFLE